MGKYDKKTSGLVIWLAIIAGFVVFAALWLGSRLIEALTRG